MVRRKVESWINAALSDIGFSYRCESSSWEIIRWIGSNVPAI